ncbi:dihydropteroate synthase [Rhizobium sp. L1K21]|uniref:dihydropteroate synthase n=1 Tax=Rhizobium sp. L1K21 TaxID=2954933 RepID=UPI0020932E2B|nr:dihydropteroate synthase [Rhizobium sp. L1K21]MCO6186209.1 dihydropteroate synthase [Rhizobium sp. L1K21]
MRKTLEPFKPARWQLAHGRFLELGPRGHIMAIVNVTPDSFSDGGLYAGAEAAIAHALVCQEEGAAILDIGGESTRPGADEVSADEELARILPVIRTLAEKTDALISVDTYRASTARAAIEAGAHIINDVWGLQREPDIADVTARTGAGVCIMHTGRGRTQRADIVEDERAFFAKSLDIAHKAGVAPEHIVLDPGFGFAKETTDINVELMNRFGELFELGYPLLAGTSRKRFLGNLTGREAAERDVATAATTALLRMAGAAIFRVHNVKANRDALAVADAMIEMR